jgi:hypothetical protein
LNDVGIDPIDGRENLFWAPTWGHPSQISRDMAKKIYEISNDGEWNHAAAADMLKDFAISYIKGKWRP